MKKPKKRIQKNFALRLELINKGVITPYASVPAALKRRGFHEAAKVAAERVARGQGLYAR